MHDIKNILGDKDYFMEKMKNRKLPYEGLVNNLVELDNDIRKYKTKIQELQSKRNTLSSSIGTLKKHGVDFSHISDEVSEINIAIENTEKLLDGMLLVYKSRMDIIPNIPADDTPSGNDEESNVIIKITGAKPNINNPLNHWDLLPSLLDFNTASKESGSRFTILKGPLAALERAIGQFMLTNNILHGYMEINTPCIVNPEMLYGTGQLPKFSEDLYKVNDQYLIPTAEVTLTNIHNGELFKSFDNAIRYTALTPCFRSEAGSSGKDTRGLIRQHQFNKVELVSICREEEHDIEFNHMIKCSTNILEQLGLSYRIVHLCDGDMGFSAKKTYDLEVWLPGPEAYREISSVSWCGDFQARRMNMRYKDGKQTRFLNTLNGSSLAVGRTLVAIMENYQDGDGNINIPDVLVKYTGFTRINYDGSI